MNSLTPAKKAQVIAALVEGNSIRATVRVTGASKNAIQRLLAAIGPVCEAYQNRSLRNLPCRKIQCDEIWSFCYAKQKNVPKDKQGQFGFGDVWTWTALCADTKLIASWKIGTRGASTAYALMHDLAGRLNHRIQLTTDGHRVYANAVESAFGSEIDYAMLVKIYGADREESEARYSPAECMGCRTIPMSGNPKARDGAQPLKLPSRLLRTSRAQGSCAPTKGKIESRRKKRKDERKTESAWLPVSLRINPDQVTGLKTLFSLERP